MEKLCCGGWSYTAKETARIINCNSVSQMTLSGFEEEALIAVMAAGKQGLGTDLIPDTKLLQPLTSFKRQTPTAAHEIRYLSRSGNASPGSSLQLWIPQPEENNLWPWDAQSWFSIRSLWIIPWQKPCTFPLLSISCSLIRFSSCKRKMKKRWVNLRLKWKSAPT